MANMLRYIKLLFLVPIGAAILGFAVLNRAPVQLTYWPQQLGGQLAFTLPLSILMLLCVIAGVIIGGIATWITQGAHRKAERQLRKEAEKLKSEAERLKSMQPTSNELALPLLKSR
jgi:uncharacterized integral membrane protein